MVHTRVHHSSLYTPLVHHSPLYTTAGLDVTAVTEAGLVTGSGPGHGKRAWSRKRAWASKRVQEQAWASKRVQEQARMTRIALSRRMTRMTIIALLRTFALWTTYWDHFWTPYDLGVPCSWKVTSGCRNRAKEQESSLSHFRHLRGRAELVTFRHFCCFCSEHQARLRAQD